MRIKRALEKSGSALSFSQQIVHLSAQPDLSRVGV